MKMLIKFGLKPEIISANSFDSLEAVTGGVFLEKMFSENTCAIDSEPTLLKKRPSHNCFPVNFANF